MTSTVGIEEARRNLGDLVTAARAGADIVITRNGTPAARLIAYREGPMSTATTDFGTWVNVDPMNATLRDNVLAALAEHVGDYDVDAIETEYRHAINVALPPGVTLNGDDFYAPYYDVDRHFDGYPLDEHGALDLRAIVDGVNADFWTIAHRHDRTT